MFAVTAILDTRYCIQFIMGFLVGSRVGPLQGVGDGSGMVVGDVSNGKNLWAGAAGLAGRKDHGRGGEIYGTP